MTTITTQLRRAAGAVARAQLSDAFGHVSLRTERSIFVTPAVPLSRAAVDGTPVEVVLGTQQLPAEAPREAWLPLAIAEAEARACAIVRAQPRATAAFAALDRDLPIITGHAAMLGRIHRHPESYPVRDRASAEQIVTAARASECLILRGNGVVVWGTTVGEAVARLWVLETTAALALRALAVAGPRGLPETEQAWWSAHSADLLTRMYDYLVQRTSEELIQGERP
jgi:HCOMODA/2-hydroxy-3-carboxy-muconic semialdehyde decarboxylase